MKRNAGLLTLTALFAACSLSTSRPSFQPMPEARVGDLELEIPDATTRLATALEEAGVPIARVAPEDGYFESPWFDTTTGRAVSGRPLGQDVVRVRGWVTPSAHGSSEIVVETVYRPLADPSRPPRELERSVPYAHPVRMRVREAYRAAGARVAIEEPDAVTLAARRAAGRAEDRRSPGAADSLVPGGAAPDSLRALPAGGDSLARRPADTLAAATPAADTFAVSARAADTLAVARPRADSAAPAAAPAAPVPARPAEPQPAQRPAEQQAQRPAQEPAQRPVQQPAREPAQPPAPQPVRPAITTPTPTPAQRTGTGYTVQVAATRDPAAADLASRRLGAMGIEPNVLSEG